MDTQVNPEVVINDLLEQNKQLTLQLAMMRAALGQAQAEVQSLRESALKRTGKNG